MTKRPTKETPGSFVQLPLLGAVAIYARVATVDKLTDGEPAQIEELTHYASALGFSDEQVTLFCDAGKQACAPLFERQGYTDLLKAIREGAVNVLFIHAEDRLFSDANELQVNTFIHLCIERGVLVVTAQMVYDFQDLTHVALFRRQCVSAFRALQDATKLMQ
jgi:predicted site-specific integrase-resolvase